MAIGERLLRQAQQHVLASDPDSARSEFDAEFDRLQQQERLLERASGAKGLVGKVAPLIMRKRKKRRGY